MEAIEITQLETPKKTQQAAETKKAKEAMSQMKIKADEIDKAKPKGKKAAATQLQKILALWVVAVRKWVSHVWRNYVERGGRAIKRLMKRIGSFILSLFNLDSPDKIEELLEKTKEVAKSSGQQALAAALMALLTSLAEGARIAMSELIKDGGSKILQAIVEGASESFSDSTTTAQPNLFSSQSRPQQTQQSGYRNPYSSSGYDSGVPPWART
jgi:hypothetical protein